MAALFPSLNLTSAEGNLDAAFRQTWKSKSKLTPPCVIQLFSSKFIHFASHSIFPTKRSTHDESMNNLAPRSFEIVSYQAAQVTDLQQQPPQQQLLEKKLDTLQSHPQPNLGIWSCCIPENKDTHVALASSSLNGVFGADATSPTFLLTIDLADPAAVYPEVTGMIQTILKLYEMRNSAESSSQKDTTIPNTNQYHPSLRTTSVSSLTSIIFGQASSSSSSSLTNHDSSPQLLSSEDPIRLILCAILPSHALTTKQNYKEKQAQRLVHYHLHRYASALNCTLLFLQDKDSSTPSTTTTTQVSSKDVEKEDADRRSTDSSTSTSTQTMVGLTVHEVAWILRKMVDFQDDDMILIPESIKDSSSTLEIESDFSLSISPPTLWLRQQGFIVDHLESSLFLPDSHDTDLIESVLVRNASCSGLWDAYKDPLWIALKPSTPEMTTLSSAQKDKMYLLGEQEWLNTLGDTLSRVAYSSQGGDARTVVSDSGTESSSKKMNDELTKGNKNNKADAPSNSTNPNKSGDVSSFFDDLLK